MRKIIHRPNRFQVMAWCTFFHCHSSLGAHFVQHWWMVLFGQHFTACSLVDLNNDVLCWGLGRVMVRFWTCDLLRSTSSTWYVQIFWLIKIAFILFVPSFRTHFFLNSHFMRKNLYNFLLNWFFGNFFLTFYSF